MMTANAGVCERCGRKDTFAVRHACRGIDSCAGYCIYSCPGCLLPVGWLTSHEIVAGEGEA